MTKITLSRASTASAAKILASFSGSVVDEHKYALIRAKADGTMTASLLGPEGALTLPLDGSSPEPCEIAVGVHLLSGLLSKLDAADVTLTPSDNAVQLSAGRQRYKLHRPAHLNGLAIPEVAPPTSPDTVVIAIDAAALSSALAFVEHAAAVKDVRVFLCGVHLRLDNGSLRVMAADGYRLAFSTACAVNAPPAAATIPIYTLRKLRPLIPTSGSITLGLGGRIFVGLPDGSLLDLPALEGRFPAAEHLIPASPEWSVEVDAEDVAASLERAMFLHRDAAAKVQGIAIDVTHEGIEAYCCAAAQEFDELIAGEAFTAGRGTGLQVNYLRDAALALGGRLRIAISENDSAVVTLRRVGDDDRVCLIMPLTSARRNEQRREG